MVMMMTTMMMTMTTIICQIQERAESVDVSKECVGVYVTTGEIEKIIKTKNEENRIKYI